MTFIITIVSLISERFLHWSHLRHWSWFGTYQRWLSVRSGKWPAYLKLIVCILPLLIVVGVINSLLTGLFYDSLKIIFGIVVVMYCLGPNNLWVQVYACIGALNQEDPNVAIEKVKSAFGVATGENSQAFHQAFTRVIFVKAYRRVFAVLFWYVILGPVGAVLYRSLTLCTKDTALGVAQLAKQAQRILDWVPVRLFTFLFALGGHFTEVINIWKKSFKQGLEGNDKLLSDCGVAALDVMHENRLPEEGSAEKDALALLDRVFIISLVLLSISLSLA